VKIGFMIVQSFAIWTIKIYITKLIHGQHYTFLQEKLFLYLFIQDLN